MSEMRRNAFSTILTKGIELEQRTVRVLVCVLVCVLATGRTLVFVNYRVFDKTLGKDDRKDDIV
jgi:hypothetical protein